MTDLSSPRRNQLFTLMLILICVFGYLNLVMNYSGRINDFTFNISLLMQVKKSYYVMLKTLNESYNDDIDAYVCNMLFTELLFILEETNTKYNAMQRSVISKKALSIENLRKARKDAMHKLSEIAVSHYPLKTDIRGHSVSEIKEKLRFMKPINNITIKYAYNPSSLCSGDDPDLLILIKSSVKNHYLRYILRNTWIKEIHRTFPTAKVAFLLGISYKERLIVWSENQVSADVIQGKFIDAYRNNTHKTFMACQWVTKYCSNAKFIFFVDDDMFVNAKLMKKFLKSTNITKEIDLLSGMVVRYGLPAREEQSPWYITKEDYSFFIYPPYLAGCAMFLSQNAVRKITAVFPYVKYFPFDDVLLGIIMNKLGMILEQNEFLHNVHLNNVTVLHKMIANHGFKDSEFLSKTYHEYFAKFHVLTKDKLFTRNSENKTLMKG